LAEKSDEPALWVYSDGKYQPISWKVLAAEVWAARMSLADLGVGPEARVIQWSENRYEWVLIDLAIQMLDAVHIPLHSTLSAEQAAQQVAHAEACLIITSDGARRDQLRNRRSQAMHSLPSLCLDEDQILAQWQAAAPGIWDRCLDEAARADLQDPVDSDQIATILYTSGTSGAPKAIALTHGNLFSNAMACIEAFGDQPADLRLCFLPLSHIYARTCDLYTWLGRGSQLALARNRDTVIEDCRAIRPSLINGVPYFYDRIAQKVLESEQGQQPLRIKDILGGNIRACFCGGAALSPTTFEFFHQRGVSLLPGYGLTETSPVVACSTLQHFRCGSVGQVLSGVEVRLAKDGELLTRGPNLMPGYWKDPETTRASIVDGWFHTGDLAEIDSDGFLFITGRKKEILVLTTGKKVVPTLVENLLCRDALVLQALVIGDARDFLTALIVPDPEVLRREIRARRWWIFGKRAATRHAGVGQLYRTVIAQQCAELSEHQRVKRFLVLDRGFTVEEGLLTPKLSLRRGEIQKEFAKEIEGLYRGRGFDVYEKTASRG
jgi:long-chain acyl-CoA synthetase